MTNNKTEMYYKNVDWYAKISGQVWSGALGRLAIHLGTWATHEPRGDASVASLGRMLRRVKILGTRGDWSPTAASEMEISTESR